MYLKTIEYIDLSKRDKFTLLSISEDIANYYVNPCTIVLEDNPHDSQVIIFGGKVCEK